MKNERIEWIDWMKVIGMYFIILGHFFSLYNKYIYVFNVPLFFMISGFLCKKEYSHNVFWKKLWYNLVLPMVIICSINYVIMGGVELFLHHNCNLNIHNIMMHIRDIIIGMHSGVGLCWFIYTLILLKIIYQYINRIFLLFLIFISCFLFMRVVEISESFHEPNAIINVCAAFPFFIIGNWSRNLIHSLNSIDNKILFLLLITSIMCVWISGTYNGSVWMYNCKYGGNFLFFILGGIAGTILVFVLSKLLRTTPKPIITLSTGTIVILGFQSYPITLFKHYIMERTWLDLIYALIVLVIFIPVIIGFEKFFPIILGRYRISSNGSD